jgi:cytochrome P450
LAQDALEYEPLEYYDNPYPIYRRLRDEAPVYRTTADGLWVLSRHEDVQATARDWHRFTHTASNVLDEGSLMFAPAGELTHADPPTHTRLRDTVRKEFGITSVRTRLEPRIRSAARTLLASMRDRDTVDLVDALALPLPVVTVCGWLGFPEADFPKLKGWYAAMTERVPRQVALPASALDARDDLRDYLRSAAAERRERPRDDLLSVLVAAHGRRELSDDELLGLATQLFIAGLATTSGLISSAWFNLAFFPERWNELKQAPDLIPVAVEEILRFDTPLQWLARTATETVEFEAYNVEIGAGERVVLLWASANRDERRWVSPDQLMFNREVKRHLSFGEGIHHCLGAPLARLETKVMFEEVLPMVDEYALAGPVERPYTAEDRTISRLPVSLTWH